MEFQYFLKLLPPYVFLQSGKNTVIKTMYDYYVFIAYSDSKERKFIFT